MTASLWIAPGIEGQLGLAVSNLDVQGALSSDALTEDDLHGNYRDRTLITKLQLAQLR